MKEKHRKPGCFHLVEHATFDLGIMSSSTTFSIEITRKQERGGERY